MNVTDLDWRFVKEEAKEETNFGKITEGIVSNIDFGTLAA